MPPDARCSSARSVWNTTATVCLPMAGAMETTGAAVSFAAGGGVLAGGGRGGDDGRGGELRRGGGRAGGARRTDGGQQTGGGEDELGLGHGWCSFLLGLMKCCGGPAPAGKAGARDLVRVMAR